MTENHPSGERILVGQTAIVTGSSSGIGAGIAGELGAAGASVVVNYAGNRDGADAVVREITGAFLCAREAAREFLRRCIVPARSQALGKMIFISSVHETIPGPGM